MDESESAIWAAARGEIPPPPAARLFGTGRVVHRGKSVAFLEGELRDASDILIATASATARLIHVESGGFEL